MLGGKWLSLSQLAYLLPHVDEEELPGNVEGHIGIIGVVPKVGNGDVQRNILHGPQSQVWGFLIHTAKDPNIDYSSYATATRQETVGVVWRCWETVTQL